MPNLIFVCLVLLVLFLLYRQWLLRRGVKLLGKAVENRRPLLESDDRLPRMHAPWRKLVVETNGLVREFDQLGRRRSDQLSQLEAALRNLQEAVLVVDGNNYILFSNNALMSIFPSAEDAVGKRVETVLRSAEFLSYLEEIRLGRQTAPRRELRFSEPGSDVSVEITGVIVPHANRTDDVWTLFVLHDVTRERRLEDVRKEFVANVSHELKTPLSVIKGYSETLVEDHGELDPEQRDQFIRAILRHAERLAAIVDDLLSLSRLESSNPGVQPAAQDLVPFVCSIVADYEATVGRAGQSLYSEIRPDERVLAPFDSLRLTQVLANLIDNARKYCPAGTRIGVGARAVPAENEAEIWVSDTGPGIPSGDLPRIFERFYRVEKGRSRGKGGTGLGLSIVKHIVQLHGGRVWAESRPGEGTRIIIRLPQAPGQAVADAGSTVSDSPETEANASG